jgi:membrane peptidoglycan carboxypeptidase
VKFQLDKPDSETNGVANGYAANTTRRDYILTSMLKERKITQAEFDTAIATPVQPRHHRAQHRLPDGRRQRVLLRLREEHPADRCRVRRDESTRLLNFRRGGYDVYTTLDLDLQNAAESAIAQNVPQTYPGWDVGAVITSVQVGTGACSRWPRTARTARTGGAADAVRSSRASTTTPTSTTARSHGFQPGSSYKVFTLASG